MQLKTKSALVTSTSYIMKAETYTNEITQIMQDWYGQTAERRKKVEALKEFLQKCNIELPKLQDQHKKLARGGILTGTN